MPAEREYQLAATLAAGDPTPLSNLSSVKFELGQYGAAIPFINKALQLAERAPHDEAAERRAKALYARLAKCCMHEFDLTGPKMPPSTSPTKS